MLFNSYAFICVFLPIAWAGFAIFSHFGKRLAGIWLVLSSLCFYGWWRPAYLLLLCGSIVFNFMVGESIMYQTGSPRLKKIFMVFGVGCNLSLLIWYKYLFAIIGFLIPFGLAPESWGGRVILPLGISFFTFTQIGYLVDCSQKIARERRFGDYALFVTFFPHLIAGPILHHKEMMPQFASDETYRLSGRNFAVGLSLFVMGLAKKVLIADQLIKPVTIVFANPHHADALVTWLALLSYSLQLYFDFSGYSDMAIGLARMFNVRFPLNFDSPYKARSIIEFWQRWHMTLTRYLNLYLFNPIAMAVTRGRLQRGAPVSRRAMATMSGFASMIMWPTVVTMGLAGIWHGAGLQFLVFGLLHASYLSINHAWRIFGPKPAKSLAGIEQGGQISYVLKEFGYGILTYSGVLLGQVFFRASSVSDALAFVRALFGFNQPSSAIHERIYYTFMSIDFLTPWTFVLAGFVIVWTMPNTQQILADFDPALGKIREGLARQWRWRPTVAWSLGIGTLGAVAFATLSGPTEFLYFEF